MNDVPTQAAHPHPFNYQLQRFMIGVTAGLLPVLVSARGCRDLTSISASYHSEARDVFVACLAAVGGLMLSYQGEDGTKREEKWLARFGGLAALAVAWVPTACPATHEATYSCLAKFACNSASQGWHIGAAAGVFVVLVRLCWIFKERAKAKKGTGKWDSNAALRMHFYRSCIALSTAGVGIIVINALEWIQWDTALFWGEVMVLAAFSIAWLTASKLILKEPR